MSFEKQITDIAIAQDGSIDSWGVGFLDGLYKCEPIAAKADIKVAAQAAEIDRLKVGMATLDEDYTSLRDQHHKVMAETNRLPVYRPAQIACPSVLVKGRVDGVLAEIQRLRAEIQRLRAEVYGALMAEDHYRCPHCDSQCYEDGDHDDDDCPYLVAHNTAIGAK